jgi:hypothetical protein
VGGKGGEMTQTLYAHMNKSKKIKRAYRNLYSQEAEKQTNKKKGKGIFYHLLDFKMVTGFSNFSLTFLTCLKKKKPNHKEETTQAGQAIQQGQKGKT